MIIGQQYKVVSELGSGGMGLVYQAIDLVLEREVAIKKLRSEFSRSPDVAQRFLREAKIQARLNHPHITQLYTCLQENELFYIVMEFVNGTPLNRLIPMPPNRLLPLAEQVLDSLEYAHGMGVLHRDIKPDNLMVTPQGAVKIMDFGIAHVLGSSRQTREKTIMGTLEYISPERITGKDPDRRSDIYSLGAVLFEALTGHLPFESASEYELLRKHMEAEPPKLRQFLPDAPEFLENVLDRALAKDPGQRFSTCREMREALSADISYLMNSGASSGSQLFGQFSEEFERYRNRIRALVESGDLDIAQRVLDSARLDYPEEKQFDTVQHLIDRRKTSTESGGEKRLQVEAVLRQLSALEEKRDWAAARELVTASLQRHPQVKAFKIAAFYFQTRGRMGI